MKSIWIYTILSILAFGIVIFPKSEVEYYDFLQTKLEKGDEQLQKTNSSLIESIFETVRDNPSFWANYEQVKLIDSLTIEYIKNPTINLSIINNEFIEEREIDSFINRKKNPQEIQALLYNLDSTQITDELPLRNTLLKSISLFNETNLLIFYASKTYRRCFHGFDFVEPIFLVQSKTTKVNQVYSPSLALSKGSDGVEIERISINNQPVKLLLNEAKFKEKATKKGWNEINVLVEGTLFDKPMQKEKTFRYFVK